ncbi:MAG: LamG-like jellyroll fold domain-containing protein [Patescibacteria group bacterium]
MAGIDSYTKLMLHMDGADGSTTFTDSSLFPKTVTKYGTAQIDTAQSKFGGASGLFDGNSDYLTIPDSDDWYFGTGDFTIDFWVRTITLTLNQNIIGQRTTADTENLWFIRILPTTGKLRFIGRYGNVDHAYIETVPGLSINTWYHIAVVRASGTCKIYIDGVNDDTVTSNDASNWPNVSTNLSIGIAYNSFFEGLSGWLDEFRISKGIARWTSNFTPPTSAYDSYAANLSLGDFNKTFSLELEKFVYEWLKILSLGDFNKTYSLELTKDLIEMVKSLSLNDFASDFSIGLTKELLEALKTIEGMSFDSTMSIDLVQDLQGILTRSLGDFDIYSSFELLKSLEKLISIGDFNLNQTWYLKRIQSVVSSLILKHHLLAGNSLILKNNLNVINEVKSSLILKYDIPPLTEINSNLTLINSLIGSVEGNLQILNRLTEPVIGNLTLRNKLTDKNEVEGTLTLKNNIDPQTTPPTYTDPEQDQANFESGLTDPESPNYNPQLASLTYFYFTEEHTG